MTKTTTTTTFEKRVADGAKFLDGRKPSWYDKINLDLLDMGNNLTCLLAQLCGEFAGHRRLTGKISRESLVSYGFLHTAEFIDTKTDYLKMKQEHRKLTQAWRREIMARRRRA